MNAYKKVPVLILLGAFNKANSASSLFLVPSIDTVANSQDQVDPSYKKVFHRGARLSPGASRVLLLYSFALLTLNYYYSYA